MSAPGSLSAEDRRWWQLNAAALAIAIADWDRWVPKLRANLATMRQANPPARVHLDRIEALIGEMSLFHDTFGYHAQGVGPETAKLPAGWEGRARPARRGGARLTPPAATVRLAATAPPPPRDAG